MIVVFFGTRGLIMKHRVELRVSIQQQRLRPLPNTGKSKTVLYSAIPMIPSLSNRRRQAAARTGQGEKLTQAELRPRVVYKVKDLSDGFYAADTIFGYYDRLNSEDQRITRLISSMCGGEPSTRNVS
jgi:hypothetical protein